MFNLIIIPLALLVAFGCGVAIVSCAISINRGESSTQIAPRWALVVVVALSVTGLFISARALVTALLGFRSGQPTPLARRTSRDLVLIGRTWTNWLTLHRALFGSVALFVICLLPRDFCQGTARCGRGWAALLFGPIGLLSAPRSTLPWLANPVLVIVWLSCLAGSRRRCLILSLIALVLAGSFLWERAVVTDESGVPSLVTWIGPGYWLWLASIMIVALAAVGSSPVDRETANGLP